MLTGLLAVYCGIVVGASLAGGFIPSIVRLGHRRMQMLLSVVGGLMLGVGLLHQLPHSIVIAKDGGAGIDWCVGWMVGGLMLTFFLIRWFHAHSHDAEHSHDHGGHGGHGHHGGHSHGPACDHSEEASGRLKLPVLTEVDLPVRESRGASPAANSSWLGIFFGLSLHTLLDGFALGAHFAADSAHLHLDEHGFGGLGWWLPGLGTLLGVALHKPLDSLSITSLMAARGWSKRHQTLVNFGYSLMCPLGVMLFHVGAYRIAENHSLFIAAAVAMAAGVFVCISLSDLLPEIEFHSHDRLLLSGLLTLGLALAWGIGFLEPEHAHSHGDADGHGGHSHASHGHVPGEANRETLGEASASTLAPRNPSLPSLGLPMRNDWKATPAALSDPTAAPLESGSFESAPSESAPSESAPSESAPSESAPSGSAPSGASSLPSRNCEFRGVEGTFGPRRAVTHLEECRAAFFVELGLFHASRERRSLVAA